MELEPIGRVDDIEELDLDAISVPLVGYTMDREEVCKTFRFRPMQPAGATLDVLKATDARGVAPTGLIMTFLDECILEDDRDSWELFLRRPDLMIEQSTLAQLYEKISEVYAARPTRRSSGSGGGGSSLTPISRAARRSKPASTASRKKTSTAR